MTAELNLDKGKTAIVVIDLQKGIASIPTEPYSSKVVIENTAKILKEFRKNSMPVFLINVTPSKDMKDALRPISETSFSMSNYDSSWSEFVPDLDIQPTDFRITKHQWGAFYGTELDLQLRRRKIETIVLCGIATNFGVESTARFAYEFGFNQVFVEDAMAARSKDEHNFPVKYIFPRLGLIRSTYQVIKALS
jgi:nicotinamidase-related amidase